jgi:hypothetical protein
MVTVNKSVHAKIRQQNRGLREEVLEFILDFGHTEYGSGGSFQFIRDDRLPSYLRGNPIVAQARPWVVMLDPTEKFIITVYAREDVATHVRRKCRKTHQWAKHLEPQSAWSYGSERRSA